MDVRATHELTEPHLLLDVREPYEWEAGRIPGALHVPMGELGARKDVLPSDDLIVVVCRSGNRSGQVTDLLNRAGYRAENMEGGMKAWRAQGLPMEADGDDEPTVA